MPPTSLRVGIVLSGHKPAAWRSVLADALTSDGHEVGFLPGPLDYHSPSLTLLVALERLLFREPSRTRAEAEEISEGPFDLIISGGEELFVSTTIPTLELLCDDAPFAIGCAAALLDRHVPILEIRMRYPGGDSRVVYGARAAVEEPHRFVRSRMRLEQRIAAAARLVASRLAREGDVATVAPLGLSCLSRTDAFAYAVRVIREGAARRLERLLRMDARWRILWRITAGDSVSERWRWPTFSYKELPDDGRRYYADPFIHRHAGQTFLFCEEFPFETQRGVLSYVEVREGRILDQPRPFLDPGTHASYPMIFERDGAIWMIPETSQAKCIGLWRASEFPDKWTYVGPLVEGVAASDATLHEQGGKLWLLATVEDDMGSSWDQLYAWSADRLEGPWTAHPANPLVIDANCARPAGRPFLVGGRLIRPVQDCSRSYGGGLALCAIDRLDQTGFEQAVVARLGPPPDFAASGVHTLNEAFGVEAVDVFRSAPRERR